MCCIFRREVLKEGMTVHLLEPGYFRTNILNTDDMKTSFENSFKQTDPDVQRYYGNGYVQKGTQTTITSAFIADVGICSPVRIWVEN